MEIYKKLFAVKSEIGKISKETTNPFFKSKYFDVNALLENVEPLLHKNNLVLLQPIKDNKVRTEIVDVETGEMVSSEIELPNLTDPQKLGSAITYYRRYTLQSLLGIQAEDDDANRASQKAPAPKQNTSQVPAQLINELAAKFTKVKDQEDLGILYNEYKKEVQVYPTLKGMFTNKKVALNGNS